MLAPGSRSPAFSLPDHHDVLRRSEDYSGRWLVVWWFPRACSEVCSLQGRDLGAIAPRLAELDVAIVGISFDPVADNARFAEQESLDFPLLSDPTREAGRAFEVCRAPDEPFADAPRRISYVVDPDGIVRAAYQVEDVAGHAETLVADLRRLMGRSDSEGARPGDR